MRSLAAIVILFSSVALAAEGDIAASLESAREAHAKGIQAAQAKLLTAVDEEIRKAAATGSLELVKSIQQEKASLETDGNYEPKAARLKPALIRYQAEVKAARDKLRTSLTSAKVAYTKQLKIAEAEAVDAEIKAIGTALPAAGVAAAPTAPNDLKGGIAVLLFDRVTGQQGNDGFIEPAKLGKAVGDASVIESLAQWKYAEDKNAVAYGFLHIDQPGEYEFRTYNHYDRNALYVAGQLICPYRGSVTGGSEPSGKERITLRKGYVPIVSVGYVDAKGGVEVTWKPPSQKEFLPIPAGLLFHQAKDGKPLNPYDKK